MKHMAQASGILFGGALQGKAGNVVFVRRSDGTIGVRPRVTPRDPQTAAQKSQRRRMAQVGAAWKALTATEAQAWRAYATTLGPQPTPKGGEQFLTAQTIFTRLGLKFLDVNPGGTLPTSPPSTAFVGDSPVVTVSDIAGSHQVTFSASAPNGADVTTELLLQPLASIHRTPVLRAYRIVGTKTFVGGSLSISVDAGRGPVACAVRFVRPSTGQATPLFPLGVMVA